MNLTELATWISRFWSWIAGVVLASCTVFGAYQIDPTTPKAVLVIVYGIIGLATASGWFAYSLLSESRFRSSLQQTPHCHSVDIIGEGVRKALESASVVRIFASGSDTYRAFLQSTLAKRQDPVEIRVLVRTDGTEARSKTLERAIAKWHSDISRSNVTVRIKLYSFDPLMLRGWLFDNSKAIIGWYERNAERTLGQSEPCYLVQDTNVVGALVRTFDRLFETAKDSDK